MSGTHTDITATKQQQVALKRKADRDEVFLKLPQWLEKHNEADFLQEMLSCLEELTQSEASFIHGYDEATDIIQLLSWSRRTLQTYCHMHEMSMHYPIKEAGIWADCVRQKQAIIVNDYETTDSQYKKGFPEGHSRLAACRIIPPQTMSMR
jgi:transcriptional regulator with GAF, ATPase, and Fis domain